MLDLLESVRQNLTEEMEGERYLDAYDSFMSTAIYSFLRAENKATWKVTWTKLNSSRLKKIWTDYARTGVVRDEKGMEDIAQTMYDSIARLDAANAISGHASRDPRSEVEDRAGRKLTDKEWVQFGEGMVHNKYGAWLVSDYGLPKLQTLARALEDASGNAEQQLLIVDQMLNVIHMRGDLSEMFVEGGRAALDFLRDQPVIDMESSRYE